MTQELTPQPNLPEQDQSHEQLVASVKNLIQAHQDNFARMRTAGDREVLAPETVIHNVLEWYSSSSLEQDDTFSTLMSAWDALVYDKYEPGSKEEGLAGSLLQSYYDETSEPSIKLTNPKQVQMFDALTEAASIQHQRGQTEIAIPEKLRNYNQYLMSQEYEERWNRAQERRKK